MARASVLDAANSEGLTIAAEMRALLERRGIKMSSGNAVSGATATELDCSISQHEAVTTELCSLMAALRNSGVDRESMALMLRAAQWEVELHCERLPRAEDGSLRGSNL